MRFIDDKTAGSFSNFWGAQQLAEAWMFETHFW
jgi:hypothetical protein